MKKLNNRFIQLNIGIVVGLLFSIQPVSGQAGSGNNEYVQIEIKQQSNDSVIFHEPAIYYLYACNTPDKNPQMNCILLLESKQEFNTMLFRLVMTENEEEEIKLEPWMIHPQAWLTKQEQENE